MEKLNIEKVLSSYDFELAIKQLQSGGSVSIVIQQFFSQTDCYQTIQHKLLGVQQQIENTQYSEYHKIQQLKEQLSKLKEEEMQFKVDLLQYARVIHNEKFSKLEIVKNLKLLLYEGNLHKSDQLLKESDLEKNYTLLEESLKIETNLNVLYEKLVVNSYEFFIKAHLTSLNYDQPFRYEKAVHFFDKAIVSARRALAHTPHLIYCLSNYAIFLQTHNQLNIAITTYEETLDLLNAANVGEEYDDYKARTYHNLGTVNQNLGLTEQSRQWYDKAEDLFQEVYFRSMTDQIENNKLLFNTTEIKAHAETFINFLRASCSNLSQKLIVELISAESNLRTAIYYLELVKETNKDEFLLAEAEFTSDLGFVNYKMKNYEESKQYYKNALFLFENLNSITNDLHLDNAANIKVDYAIVLFEENDFVAGLEILHEAVTMYKSLFPKDPRKTSISYFKAIYLLALSYYSKNNLEEAKKAYEQALSVLKDTEMDGSMKILKTAKVTKDLGFIYRDQGRPGDAITMWAEAIPLIRNLCKEDADTWLPVLTDLLSNLGILYDKDNKVELAEKCFIEALSIRRQLAKQFPDEWLFKVANTLNNAARLYFEHNDLLKAEPLWEEAVVIRVKLAEKDPATWEPKLADILNNLGLLKLKLGKFREAVSLLENCLIIRYSLAITDQVKYKQAYAETAHNLNVVIQALQGK